MSFRLKTIIGIALIEILLLGILVYSSMDFLKTSNENQISERARTSAQLFSTMTADAVVAMDLATLDEMVRKTITNPDIEYIRVRHDQGFILSELGNDALLKRPFQEDRDIQEAASDQIFDISHPISVAGEIFGTIEMGLSTQSLQSLLAKAQNRMLTVALVEVVLVGIFGFMLGGMLTRQLTSLQSGAKKVARGELGHQITVLGKDELADTAMSFNEMSKELASYARDLEHAKARADEKRLQAETMLGDAVESLSQGILIVDDDNTIKLMNRAYRNMYDIADEDLAAFQSCDDICTKLSPQSRDGLICNPKITAMEMPVSHLKNERYIMHSYKAMRMGGGVWVDTDITAVMEAEAKARKLERELLHSQKMESIGTLAGGIAHEINTPIQYIGDNLKFMGEATSDMMTLFNSYNQIMQELKAQNIAPQALEAINQAQEDADIAFLMEELPDAVAQSIQGVKQVSKIVLAMKEFAHPSSKEKALINLNSVVERSVMICQSEWKHAADLEMNLDENLAMIMAHEGDLNQVVLNMVVNAAHAIEERTNAKGQIAIKTKNLDDAVMLSIEDNGRGIAQDMMDKIFDPFFTTKEVGKGSGQGLAISRDIIFKKHQGKITVDSDGHSFTRFEITLPKE